MPTKGTKSGKPNQNGKEEHDKLKIIKTPLESNSSEHSQCKLSPLESHLSYFFFEPPC
jgi:hypothetical protein